MASIVAWEEGETTLCCIIIIIIKKLIIIIIKIIIICYKIILKDMLFELLNLYFATRAIFLEVLWVISHWKFICTLSRIEI